MIEGVPIGGGSPPLLIAGPCVIESEDMALRHADKLLKLSRQIGLNLVFKASYDKANRTSLTSFRGPGLIEGLRILKRIRQDLGVPIITDAHSVAEIEAAAETVDIIQIPAFLCRQTDLLVAAAKSGRVVNVKKGQFLAPEDMAAVVGKVIGSGGERLIFTERGTSFGYHRLVVDFTGIVQMRELGWPVVFDATHSVQRPGGEGDKSGGDRRWAPYLAWAAASVGVDGLFVETHENPDQALSDGANMLPLDELRSVLEKFIRIWETASAFQ
ncbi:MAG: 3-deoxy-8-phosphooctulonate synthase [Calditrichota bacterium]